LQSIFADIDGRVSCAAIARRHRVAYSFVLDLAASRRVKAASAPTPPEPDVYDVYVKFIAEISKRFLHGKLPAPEVTTDFVSMCLQVFVPEGTDPKVRENVAFNLVRGLNCLRSSELVH